MIVYHHASSPTPPRFLMGARDLCCCSALRGGHFWGIGHSYLCGFADGSGINVGDGWTAAIAGSLDPYTLHREMVGQPLVAIQDMHGRGWITPIILTDDGSRAFPVKYGRDWKPVLTAEQTQLLDYAKESRCLLPRIIGGSNAEREELMPTACTYAAAALAYSNHLTSDVLSGLDLLDTALVVGVLTALCSYVEDTGPDHA